MGSSRRQLLQHFIEGMGTVHRQLAANRDKHLAEFGLNRAQAEVLFAVVREPALTIKDLAARLNCTSSAATQLVEGLAEEGFLIRDSDPADRRLVRVKLSPSGQDRFRKFKGRQMGRLEKLLAPLSDKELALLAAIPDKILGRHE